MEKKANSVKNMSEMKEGVILPHEILYDANQQQRWTIGSFLGMGDIGEMYEAALFDDVTNKDLKAVVQIELYRDGTPSAQMKFYIDNASPAAIQTWKNAKTASHLGVQAVLGSGSHQCNGEKYRFVVLDWCEGIRSIKTIKEDIGTSQPMQMTMGDSVSDFSQDKLKADVSTNPIMETTAASNKATSTYADSPKVQGDVFYQLMDRFLSSYQNDHSMQFETQEIKTDGDSRANSESYTADSTTGCMVRGDYDYTCSAGSKIAGTEAEFSETMENIDAMPAEKIQTSELQKSPPSPVSSGFRNSPPLDVDASSCSQSRAKAVKRKTRDTNEVRPKRSKRISESVEKENQQLDDSGIVVDNATFAPQNTPLHEAVNAKNLADVKALLEDGTAICTRNADGNTPIHLAFLHKNRGIMDTLLTAIETTSSYENVKNCVGLTTLHIACTRNNGVVIRNLLKFNEDLKDSVSDESPTWKGFTALHFAAKYRSVEAMKILTEASAKSDLIKKNSNEETPLQIINKQLEDLLFMSDLLTLDYKYNAYDNFSNFHVACARDDPDMVRSFLKKGAPIDTPVYKAVNICSWYYPLHFAVERKSAENARILVENGADLTITNNKNMTPLHLAMYTEKNGERTELVDLLYRATKNKEANPKDKCDLSYFHVACTRNDMDLVKQLLDENEDVNSRVNYRDRRFYNYTPLHFATLYDNAELARLLIERGADVNACDDAHSGTPLHIAFDFGYEELIEILLNSGANPKAVSPLDKQTMLHYLVGGYVKVHENSEEALLPYVEKLIVEFGVDVNAKDHEGDTALHIACEQFCASAPVAKLLLEFGADINVENHKGKTPFEWAMHGKMNNWKRDDADQLEMLYHHVKKLETFGFEVNEKNERCCEQLIKKRRSWKIENLEYDCLVAMEQEREREVEQMKRVELSRELSLYDFLRLEPGRYDEVAQLDVNLITSKVDEFPNYGYLIKMQLRKMNVPKPQAQVDR